MNIQSVSTTHIEQPNIQNLRLEKAPPKEVGIINQSEKILPSIEPGLGRFLDVYA